MIPKSLRLSRNNLIKLLMFLKGSVWGSCVCACVGMRVSLYIALAIKVVRDTVDIKKLEDYKRGEVGVYEE